MAPARTLLRNLPMAIADVLAAHRVPHELIDAEVIEMADVRVESENRNHPGVADGARSGPSPWGRINLSQTPGRLDRVVALVAFAGVQLQGAGD